MNSLKRNALCVLLFIASPLSGCTLISKDGPSGDIVTGEASLNVAFEPAKVDYALVKMSPEVVAFADRVSPTSMRRFSGWRSSAQDLSIGIGDIVSVTLFESESGGLFISKDAVSRPGNYVQIPNEQVDRDGNIIIPYIDGPVHAAGRTTRAIANEITSRLKTKAIEPQTVVSLVEHRGNDIAVLGDVSTASRFSLDPGGMRLSGAIAKAGGPKNPAYETLVTVKRRGVSQTAELTAIVKDSSQDIAMAPGDMVYVSHEPRVYMVIGATPSPGAIGGVNNRRFTFENETMSLAEAISKAGGLDSARSDPSYVFVFRYEAPKLLRDFNVNVDQYHGSLIPTVYQVNFASADGFFLSSKFEIRDKDIIFVSDSAGADVNKLLTIAVGASNVFYNTAVGVSSASAIR